MPVYSPPKSLKCLAFDNVVKHMDSLWSIKYLEDWENKHLLYVEGPFDILTPEMCHDIFRELIEKKVLKKHHIYLLINPVSVKIDYIHDL